MKVQGSGGGAEYGNPADITTTSKSGTNAFHGSVFEYFQNAALDATRFIRSPPVELRLPKVQTHSGCLSADHLLGSAPSSLATTKACGTGLTDATHRDGTRPRPCGMAIFPILRSLRRKPDLHAARYPDASLQLHYLDGTPYPGNIIPTGEFDPRAPLILQYYPLPIQGAWTILHSTTTR